MQFGTPDHFRIEFVNIVVANFDGTYHAILGRPSLTRFMVVLHYSNLVLKIPTENGVLVVRGNVYSAYTCEEESFKVTEAIDLSVRMAETISQATQAPPPNSKYPSSRPQGRTSSPKSTRKSDWSTTIPRRQLPSEPI
jgi:hypothetical protein